MDIPNPYAPRDPAIKEHLIELFRKIKPDFHTQPRFAYNYVEEAKNDLTPAQKRQFIAEHRHEAEKPLDERSRSFMGVLIQLGAKDLDITNAVDEMFHYLDTADADLKGLRSLFKADSNLIAYNIHPKNFDQINRFLKHEHNTLHPAHEILHEWQGFVIRKGAKKKAFRQHPGFAWLKTSTFANDPLFAEAVAKIDTPNSPTPKGDKA